MTRQEVKCLPAEYYNRFLSRAASDLKLNAIGALSPLGRSPGVLSLLVGKPNETEFPFTSVSLSAISPNDPSQEVAATLTSSALKEALQYSPSDGLPKTKEWILGLQEYLHKRKNGEGWTVTVGVGSHDLLYKAVMVLINHGDSILIESPGFPGIIPVFASLHCEQIEVGTDSMGLNPASLRETFENWPAAKPKPKLLYTVPYGSNPGGTTTTTQRRREILALARKHDFLILEDDPYYWLYYKDDERPHSYFQLELGLTEVGRVLRFDSFSKIISPGMRLGWASGPGPLINAINVQSGSSNLQPPALTQAVLLALVERWGYGGFETFTRKVSSIYRVKRDMFDKALQMHLGDMAEWSKPESGLFFWVRLLLDPNDDGESDTEKLVSKGIQNGVLVLPGSCAFPSGKKSAHVRLSFSLLSEEMVHEALRRLRAAIVSERKERALAIPGSKARQNNAMHTEGSVPPRMLSKL